jgi:uncharacterized phage protein (TIGR01671 family)
MNRIIKFRAWDKEENVMGEVITMDLMDAGSIRYFLDNSNDIYDQYKEKCELMQFTGLLDKNGKEIYEGDIIREDEFIGDVRFLHGSFLIWYGNVPNDWCHEYIPCYVETDQLKDGEVIGNIYSNPELLKEIT